MVGEGKVALTLNDYTEANRQAWNEVTPLHQKAAKEKWDRAFLQPGFSCLDEREVSLLRQMGIAGRDVAHLCCNNGCELLSVKNLGAGRCVGFDIADETIKEASERAARCGIDCQFARSDVYAIGAEWFNQFDVVYVTAGALGWLPDLTRFFAQAAALLRPGGHVFIHEIHPLSEMLPFDSDENANPLRIVEPYFKSDPYVDCGGLDYVGHTAHESILPQYWFVHSLADIVMGLVQNGLALEHFSEHPEDISAGHAQVERANAGVPLSLVLMARKG
jgi:2-polyprenyl-3-methyl-5-hydroxy-6-metoxy-1,4-benzoquinol methylase